MIGDVFCILGALAITFVFLYWVCTPSRERESEAESEARQKLEDVAMRCALYELVWKKAHPKAMLPSPRMSDIWVRAELRKLLR